VRLGVSLHIENEDPEAIARQYILAGYCAAACPPVSLDQPDRIRLIREAFSRHNLLLAEVGVWNNMMDPDEVTRRLNLEVNIQQMALAEEIGAVCCVNIAGSFHPSTWDGPHPNNLSAEAFELTVQNVRAILQAVKPTRSYYTLETMPWVIPDDPESYLQLIAAIDHPRFAVHLDPVNMINCPSRYYHNADFLRECFSRLGPWIVACHAKDIRMAEQYTTHLEEVRPGLGALDYRVFLEELNRLGRDVPLLLEHLPQSEYPLARAYVLGVAEECGLSFQ
jgi:sugar phosphate isomerase/epimerase